MSCLWGLSLLYAASFLQSRAMADDGIDIAFTIYKYGIFHVRYAVQK